MTKTRLEAFSDAVIAIIITIMVLELKTPHGTNWKNDLLPLLPVFLSYVVSFIMLGIYWGNHHHLIHTTKEVNSAIIFANLHLLFWLSLVPFVTGWVGETEFDTLPMAAYSFISAACGAAYYILLAVIKKSNRDNPALREVLKNQTRKCQLSCILYTLAIPASFISTYITVGIIALVGIIWTVLDKNIERSVKQNHRRVS